jgi:two-component system, OmpR family, sensor histidine kinase MprB
MTIRRRLAVSAAIAVAIAVLAASCAAYLAVRSQLRGEVDSTLRERAEAIQLISRSGRGTIPTPPKDLRLPKPPQARFGGATGIVQFISATGRLRQGPAQQTIRVPLTSEAKEVALGKRGSLLQDQTVAGDHLRVLTEPLEGGGAVQVARPLDEVDSVLRELLAILAIVAAGGIALAALLGALVSRASLIPVTRFTDETESIAGGADLSRRLPEDGKDDELGRLARTYNATLDALQRSSDAQRQMISDASHELRTPLASLKANLELLLRGKERLSERDQLDLEQDLIEQIDDIARLVSDVVELARRGEPEQLLDDVDLETITAAEIERARRHTPGLTFEAKLEPCTVHGVPERIARAVHNLLDNAAKWSPEGGAVEVRLAGGAFSVRDHGPGFREEDLPFVFDRFYRAADARSRPGSGLGLAIVRQTAEAHGAEVEAANAPGGGAVLTLRFPVEASAATPGS